MKSKKNKFLDDWIFTKNIPSAVRRVNVHINFRKPGIKEITKIKIEERKKYSDNSLRTSLKSIRNSKLVEQIELFGTRSRPFGVTGWTSLNNFIKLSRLKFIRNIVVKRMDGAKRKTSRKTRKRKLGFFCVKMTVSIQIEGFSSGMQLCEDRYVLVRAQDAKTAYTRVKKNENNYGKPYLNSDLRLVKWKIESYDDCYETDIRDLKDFESLEGVEVFSILKSRKLTKERAWK